MSKWSQKYREKLKGLNKNPVDYEEEELLQQEKWCALTEILDEFEEDIEILQNNYNCIKSEKETMYERLLLLIEHLKFQGYTDVEINKIIKLKGD